MKIPSPVGISLITLSPTSPPEATQHHRQCCLFTCFVHFFLQLPQRKPRITNNVTIFSFTFSTTFPTEAINHQRHYFCSLFLQLRQRKPQVTNIIPRLLSLFLFVHLSSNIPARGHATSPTPSLPVFLRKIVSPAMT